MQRVIREKFSNHTILAVAHKLDTILDFDKVAMLEAGQLIEFEDPYTLLSTDSAFNRLYTYSMAEENDKGDDMDVEVIVRSSGTQSVVSSVE
jgi:ATP-binding cassette, subfamily C (CFTR/MRP), member 1